MSRFAEAFTFEIEGRPRRWRRLIGLSLGLVYLCYPVIDLITGKNSVHPGWQLAALASFVTCYVATVLSPDDHETHNRWTMRLLGLTTAMAAVYPLIFGPSWLALPIFVAVVWAMALPPRQAVAGIALLVLIVLADGAVGGADGGTISLLVLQVITLGVLFMGVRNTR